MRIGRNEQKINRPEREEPGGVGVGAARARCEKNHTTSRRRERRSSTVLRAGGERGGQGRGGAEERTGENRNGGGSVEKASLSGGGLQQSLYWLGLMCLFLTP